MHIILSILAIVMYLVWIAEALRRNGFRLSSFNPFSIIHRRNWNKARYANPLYNLTDACDVITVLLISLIKATGEISKEQKQAVLLSLCREFSISHEDATTYFAHCSFLMRDTVDILEGVPKIIAPLIGHSTPEQIETVRRMMNHIATEDGKSTPTAYQQALINKVMQLLEPKSPKLGQR